MPIVNKSVTKTPRNFSISNDALLLLAEDRIATTSDPISEIAQSLAYDSVSAFAKAFREVTGYGPKPHRIPTITLVSEHDEIS